MRHGFTLLEILLSVALIGLLTGVGAPIFQNLQVRNALDVAENGLVSSLHRARTLARSVKGDTSWGVKIATSSVTLFKGASFATRASSSDEIFDIAPTISITGVTEFVFTKFTGLPSISGTTTLTSAHGESRPIHISTQGVISY